MSIKELSKLPKEAHKALKQFCEEEEFDFPKNISDLEELIRECSFGSRERKDSNYIYTDYTLKIGNWKFEAYGSSYLKDGGICDEEMSNEISVTNLIADKKKKDNDALKNAKKWEVFIKKSSKKEILEKIKSKNIKFA